MKYKTMIVLVSVILCCVLPICIVWAESRQAEVVEFDIKVDGQQRSIDMPVVTIDNWTYLPLRKMCDLLNVNIDWIEEEQTINIWTNDRERNSLSLSDFKFLTLGMDMDEIFTAVGEPDHYEGSGMLHAVYCLDNGNTLHLTDRLTGKLQIVNLGLADGSKVKVEFNDNGAINILAK